MLRMPNVLRAFEPRIESRSARSEMETHGQIDASAALARTGARRPTSARLPVLLCRP